MTRDANQIAQEYGRQHTFDPLGGGQATNTSYPVGPFDPRPKVKPRVGSLTVWRNLQDKVDNYEGVDQFSNVTVQMGPGVIIVGDDEGSTYLLYPEPGWYCEFIPNDEGE